MNSEHLSIFYDMLLGILGIITTVISLYASLEFRKSTWRYACYICGIVIIIIVALKFDSDNSSIKESELKKLLQQTKDSIFFTSKFDELLKSQGYTWNNITNIITVADNNPVGVNQRHLTNEDITRIKDSIPYMSNHIEIRIVGEDNEVNNFAAEMKSKLNQIGYPDVDIYPIAITSKAVSWRGSFYIETLPIPVISREELPHRIWILS